MHRCGALNTQQSSGLTLAVRQKCAFRATAVLVLPGQHQQLLPACVPHVMPIAPALGVDVHRAVAVRAAEAVRRLIKAVVRELLLQGRKEGDASTRLHAAARAVGKHLWVNDRDMDVRMPEVVNCGKVV
jgi:hypothetical protein